MTTEQPCEHVSIWEFVDSRCPKCGKHSKTIEVEMLDAWIPGHGELSKRFEGVSREFLPGAGVYNGPPMFLILQSEYEAMKAVVDAARNVVAQWRGDISRKPHIGRLRDALAALRQSDDK